MCMVYLNEEQSNTNHLEYLLTYSGATIISTSFERHLCCLVSQLIAGAKLALLGFTVLYNKPNGHIKIKGIEIHRNVIHPSFWSPEFPLTFFSCPYTMVDVVVAIVAAVVVESRCYYCVFVCVFHPYHSAVTLRSDMTLVTVVFHFRPAAVSRSR